MMERLEKDIGFVALGGAGLGVAARLQMDLSDRVCVSVIDTDARALAASTVGVKLQAGSKRTGGQGCGGDVGQGRLSVEDEISAIRDLVLGQRMVVVFAGLGGGTGSGGIGTVLRAARESECFSVAVVTMPFGFEGAGRLEKAAQALSAVQETADLVLALSNDRVVEHIGDRDVATTFAMADAILGESVAALCNLFVRPGYIQLDLGDLRRLARHCGAPFSLGFGAASGADRVDSALRQLLDGPLLNAGQVLEQASGVMVGILGGEDLRLSEISAVMSGIQLRTKADCQLVMGTTIDAKADDSLTLVLLCTDTWDDEAPPTPVVSADSPKPARGSRNRGKKSQLQPLLGLDMSGKDRFKGVEATIIDGEDLDSPTYVRRGIHLEK
jgi:cell division protein FtsZ